MKIKQIITKTHFYLLVFILLNLVFKLLMDFSLFSSITFVIKIIIYFTGIILFFYNIKPFKKVSFYFSYFVLTPLIAVLFWFFHGLFLGMLTSLFLFPITPNEILYEKANFKVYEIHNGFFGACCNYEIKEQKFFLFEKHLGVIKHEGTIDFKKFDLNVANDSIKMKMEEADYDYIINLEFKFDTIIIQKIQ